MTIIGAIVFIIKVIIVKCLPFLFSQCPSKNFHYKGDDFCHCEVYHWGPVLIKINKEWERVNDVDKLPKTTRENQFTDTLRFLKWD